ncbi:3-dehydroquinate synthase [Lasius niger]|uniref:3-dehydroquinate synthase n=1 Tax=Lasius niger TaxID=67767 RepID=A0A0J7K0C9_LASNI|nr:3-dehydroquinate synthase [Lasius niger]
MPNLPEAPGQADIQHQPPAQPAQPAIASALHPVAQRGTFPRVVNAPMGQRQRKEHHAREQCQQLQNAFGTAGKPAFT